MLAALLSAERPITAAAHPAPLGIGFPYMPVIPPEVYRSGLVDFVELTPEALCRERKENGSIAFELVPQQVRHAQEVCRGLPMVVHGVQLSIGSAHGWNSAYLDMLEQLQQSWQFLWHSEHLSFQTIVDGAGEVQETGVPLPLPNTMEAVNTVIERSAAIARRFGVPFLLENPAHYLELGSLDSDEIGDEIDLMNHITASGHCGQLLDLHNLYCNAVNHGFDAYKALDRLSLENVTEIHIAGGTWRDGFLMDAHDNVVPQPVWDLLAYVLPRAPKAAGVLYEVLDRYVPKVGVAAMLRELERVRTVWEECRYGRRAVRAVA
jgi:uncharacterized protein (UPF0276 family)